jgi:hypothetical protein
MQESMREKKKYRILFTDGIQDTRYRTTNQIPLYISVTVRRFCAWAPADAEPSPLSHSREHEGWKGTKVSLLLMKVYSFFWAVKERVLAWGNWGRTLILARPAPSRSML